MSDTHPPLLSEETEQNAEVVRVFARRFNALLNRAGVSEVQSGRVKAIKDTFNVSVPTARKWIGGEAIPSPVALVNIADRFSSFGASVDWMLGRGAEGTAVSSVQIPVLVSTQTGIPSADEFAVIGEITWHPTQDWPETSSWRNRTVLINWAEYIDPPFRIGDPLIIDSIVRGLPEDDVFLVRTCNLTSIRRIRKGLNGEVTLIKETSAGREVIPISQEKIVFGSSPKLSEMPGTDQLIVLGRVVGHGRRIRWPYPKYCI